MIASSQVSTGVSDGSLATNSLVRSSSIATNKRPARDLVWIHKRTLSVPNVHRVNEEWDRYQKNDVRPLQGKIQIDLLNIRTDAKIRRPLMRVKMGSAQYYSARSSSPTGDWNEGFMFVVSYHAQLFDTIDFDLYDKPRKHWPSKTYHIGKAKLKLSKLQGRDDVFVTFLPLYEYRTTRSLPADIRDTLISYAESTPLAKAAKKIQKNKLIGSVQVRVRYRYQSPGDIPLPKVPPFEGDEALFLSYNCIQSSASVATVAEETTSQADLPFLLAPPSHLRRVSIRPDVTGNGGEGDTANEDDNPTLSVVSSHTKPQHVDAPALNTRSSSRGHGHGELAQDEVYIDSVFRDRLTTVMSTHMPNGSTEGQHQKLAKTKDLNSMPNQHKSVNDTKKRDNELPSPSSRTYSQRCSTHDDSCDGPVSWIKSIILKSTPSSSRGKRYGFSQNDANETTLADSTPARAIKASSRQLGHLRNGASRRAKLIIQSVNFGDKNFASQWMQDTFDDVALSHPVVDRLISFVVSSQTRSLLRAIIKLANAFGQGFRVKTISLFKALILIQKYYSSLPRPSPSPQISDPYIVVEGCHYFRYALIAYGWRGLYYLGAYGKYIRGARHRRSNKYAIIRYLGIHPEDLLGYEYGMRKGAVFQPSYFVAVDRSRKAIVLSIRGTWSLYDAITDLVCEYRPFKGGLVHAGMLASAQWFYTNIVPQIFRYIRDHRQSVSGFVITGHSLGGGTASLLTMMVADHIQELRHLSDNPSFRLHGCSYAPVASSSFDLNNKYKEYIHSFICQDDIVGRLSYGTAMELKELVMDTISAYKALGGWYKVMSNPDLKKVCFDVISQRRRQLYESNEQLYPLLYIPGQIVHIRRTRETRFGNETPSPSRTASHRSWVQRRRLRKRAKEVTQKIPGATRKRYTAHMASQMLSNEMVISSTCIEDHMLASYQQAFDQLRATYGQP